MDPEERLEEILDAWQEAFDRGTDLPAAELCRGCPDLLPEVERRVAVIRRMARLNARATPDPTVSAAPGDNRDGPGVAVPHSLSIAEDVGSRIGPYKLLQQIGEGGMGVVYMAEQEHPVRRRVALKVIKPGMDSKQVVARFEAERQALALMDHPNIARVLDAWATDSGRPYFVMELVNGIPITRYCDDAKLTPR
ncbi:MAG TPA: protein kinase, partial [Gemmataceae bacterium]|nr:protein kinase [Gemmataceae bacterium]